MNATLGVRVIAAALVALVVSGCTPEEGANQKRIGLFLYADHSAINASRDGFLGYVQEHPEAFGAKPDIVIRNVGGDATKLGAYADYFSAERFDLVAALGTPCAKALSEKNRHNKAVFAAPPDAKAAGILADTQHPGGMITGVTYRPPVARIVEVIRSISTATSRVGLLHNPAEANSRLVVEEFLVLARQAGLKVVVRPVNDPSEIAAALDALLGDIDVFFAPNDNTVHAGFAAVVERATPRGIPIVSVDRGSVEAGALVGVGGDYFEIGRITAELGAQLLGGSDPATTPVVEAARATRIYINQRVADKIGVNVSRQLIEQAEIVQ